MPIYAIEGKKKLEIINLVTKLGGQVIKECPLKAKIGGVVVDFISYKGDVPHDTGHSSSSSSSVSADSVIKAVININPNDLDLSALNKILKRSEEHTSELQSR